MLMTRKSIRRQGWKKKISLTATALILLGSSAYARQVFVPGGWNTLYSERFTPTIGRSRGYDNARTNRRHYSWVKAHTIENLEKSYQGHKIFDKFKLEIPSGKMVGIYGPSGAGKSTLLNIIGLIEDYDDGEYYFAGDFAPAYNSSRALKLRRHHIAYLFQNFALIEDESIEKNLSISLLYAKLSKKEKRHKMKTFLKQVQIHHPLNTKVYRLSGGEKQRVALARALLKESKLILADEPTGSLDLENKNTVINLLKKEVEKGKTVIIVTHDSSIKAACDFVINI